MNHIEKKDRLPVEKDFHPSELFIKIKNSFGGEILVWNTRMIVNERPIPLFICDQADNFYSKGQDVANQSVINVMTSDLVLIRVPKKEAHTSINVRMPDAHGVVKNQKMFIRVTKVRLES